MWEIVGVRIGFTLCFRAHCHPLPRTSIFCAAASPGRRQVHPAGLEINRPDELRILRLHECLGGGGAAVCVAPTDQHSQPPFASWALGCLVIHAPALSAGIGAHATLPTPWMRLSVITRSRPQVSTKIGGVWLDEGRRIFESSSATI